MRVQVTPPGKESGPVEVLVEGKGSIKTVAEEGSYNPPPQTMELVTERRAVTVTSISS